MTSSNEVKGPDLDPAPVRSLHRGTSTDLYQPAGRSSRLRWALALAGVLAIAVTAMVVSRGDGAARDAIADVRFVRGEQPRNAESLAIATSVADIAEASVSSQGSTVVFEVTTATDIPNEFARSSLEFRFDISEAGRPSWIVTGSVSVSPTAVVVSQTTDYTATTIDGNLPGEVEVSGNGMKITLAPSEIDGFPENFEWRLSSTLNAFRDITGSTRVEDRFPDQGEISFGS